MPVKMVKVIQTTGTFNKTTQLHPLQNALQHQQVHILHHSIAHLKKKKEIRHKQVGYLSYQNDLAGCRLYNVQG